MIETTNGKKVSEITLFGKIAAGIMLIFFLLLPIWMIMAYWPTSIPNPTDKVKLKPLYINEIYHVRLACIPDSVCCIKKLTEKEAAANEQKLKKADSLQVKIDSLIAAIDSLKKLPQDTVTKARIASGDTVLTQWEKNKQALTALPWYYTQYDLIDFSTLLLILVAAAGFLGNMIHIATSFTTFVGNDEFKKSWLLWYFVKPFTASGLALGLYFVFRGGFLNYTADAANINLYGILTISVLAGLFTDKATIKLGEIFEVVFGLKGGDKRSDKLANTEPKIISVSPDKLIPDKLNTIILKGENLDKVKFTYKINGESIVADTVTTTATAISIAYTIPETQADKTSFRFQVLDEKGKEFFAKEFPL